MLTVSFIGFDLFETAYHALIPICYLTEAISAASGRLSEIYGDQFTSYGSTSIHQNFPPRRYSVVFILSLSRTNARQSP